MADEAALREPSARSAARAAMRQDLRSLATDLALLASGGEAVATPAPCADERDDESDGSSAHATEDEGPEGSSEGEREPRSSTSFQDISAKFSSSLSSLLAGGGAWSAGWSWNDCTMPPPGTPPRRREEAAPLMPTAGTLLRGAAEGSPGGEDMASISLTAEGDAVEEVGTPSQSGAKEASLLEAVGGLAMSLIAPQCPCPLPVSSSLVRSIYASDAWEEEEEEEERLASGGAAAAGEPPSFERIMRASGGHIRLEALDVLSTAAAQAAIRTRACMSETDRGGYDAMLEGVREALRTRGDQAKLPTMHAASLPPPPSASSPSTQAEQPKASEALTPLLSEAASCAASLVSACAQSFAAELAAAEAEGAGACSVPTVARAEDSQRWQGCEGVAALALERLHSRGLRRLGEAASRVLSQLQSMAASLAAGEATRPASGGLPWPVSTLNKAHLVAACIACVEADTQRLLELFAAALARVVGLLDDAGLVEPAARVRSKAEAHHARLLSAQAAADALRAQAARLMIYPLAATHVATAV